ncbi:MAG: hypothetical protein P8P24_03410 [Planktomarina sp.]|nr:hypothetical protein [Planktomarina sp.]MDT2070031.1 hypothetical protein [Planktomarina sp.]
MLGLIGSMMQHTPMNTIICVCLAALQSLYQQTITIGTILLIYHLALNPVDIFNPIGLAGVFCSAGLSAWPLAWCFDFNILALPLRQYSFVGHV